MCEKKNRYTDREMHKDGKAYKQLDKEKSRTGMEVYRQSSKRIDIYIETEELVNRMETL